MELTAAIEKTLTESVNECFSSVLQVSLLEIPQDLKIHTEECIISFIGFAGDVEGNVGVIVPKPVACLILSKMLGMEITEMSPDVTDGIGEILNMIAGGMKNRLIALGHKTEISIPNSVVGKAIEVLPLKDASHVTRSFAEGDIRIDVLVNYRVHKDQSSKPSAAAEGPVSIADRLENLINQNKKSE